MAYSPVSDFQNVAGVTLLDVVSFRTAGADLMVTRTNVSSKSAYSKEEPWTNQRSLRLHGCPTCQGAALRTLPNEFLERQSLPGCLPNRILRFDYVSNS